MTNHEFSIYISRLATKSMLFEVSATPKPGLVDRENSGSHNDMDFFTFLSSSIVLSPYFYECSMAGIKFQEDDYKFLLNNIRPIGIEAEKNMFCTTNGVNTHKGLIFSLGIIATAAGNLFKKKNTEQLDSREICSLIKSMSKDLTEELYHLDQKDNLTYGERLYKKYGVKGIRGEVESGFATVTKYSLPVFKELIRENKYHINHILVQVLLHLISNTEDCNILGRNNMETLKYAQEKAKEAIEVGGYLTPEGKRFVKQMDRDFVEKNISPGGAADLLAVTLMLYYLENGD
ncbi:triphosphoribosyl-dephospho-CoA synthase CitG [Tissierella praeacuta]|uniref:triphosphoribosyl-dephospho-CoA synthase CitG n=1 Tax=Tissierella praeacuta TaxID=43131 RepID=UPI00104C58AC|nr:triphosphoribosyl-dephospho-CoA synthase CitG [Tissierella praeacuta]TCU79511.1 triphosphoribosyl-dephospho-CoA synthase [Tissierella praeacuta]